MTFARPALVATALFTVAASASASLIVNGSFEESSLNPGGGWVPLGGGSTAIDGWTTTGGGVDYMSPVWVPADGIRTIDLNNTSAGGIQQSFATVVGAEYLVTFALSANMFGGPAEKIVEVSAGGQSELFVFDYVALGATAADPKWVYHEWTFVATSTTSTLWFQSLVGGVFGPSLDDVTVIGLSIPAPGALALLALAGIAPRRRRA